MRVHPAVATTVAIVLATSLVSGPLVGAVDLSAADAISPDGNFGDGSVTVGDVTLPDRVLIERGDFGAGSYYLRVPTATVELHRVVGQPIVSYELSIPTLGFTTSTIAAVSASDEGRFDLTLGDEAFSRDRFDDGSFAGELVVDVRSGDRRRVLARQNVTIEVVE